MGISEIVAVGISGLGIAGIFVLAITKIGSAIQEVVTIVNARYEQLIQKNDVLLTKNEILTEEVAKLREQQARLLERLEQKTLTEG